MQASSFGEDGTGGLGPNEGLWIVIVVGNVAVDGGLEVDDRAKAAALEPSTGERREEGLHRVQPGSRSGSEVEGPARMVGQPGGALGMLMSSVIVGDGVNDLAGRHSGLDGVEEADELLMAVTLHAAAKHRALQNIESGKQGGCAVALVIVGRGSRLAGLQWQARLGAVECLDLALLVDRQDDGVCRRAPIKGDEVLAPLGAGWV